MLESNNMKVFYIILGIIALSIASYFIFFKEDKITNYPSRGTNIIAFGDSLVQGVGAAEGADFVSLLSKEIGEPIVNAGISGNTTVDGLARLEKDVLSKNPKIVILLLGGNDYLRKIDKKITFNNLQKMVDEIHKTGAIVLLLGVRGGLLRDTYRGDFDDFAKRNHVAYVPNVLDNILGDAELMADQIHPNASGYKIIAAKVASVLRKLL